MVLKLEWPLYMYVHHWPISHTPPSVSHSLGWSSAPYRFGWQPSRPVGTNKHKSYQLNNGHFFLFLYLMKDHDSSTCYSSKQTGEFVRPILKNNFDNTCTSIYWEWHKIPTSWHLVFWSRLFAGLRQISWKILTEKSAYKYGEDDKVYF